MSIGSSQTSAWQITGLLGLPGMVPDPTTSIGPGLALVNISATDDKLLGLPNSPAALLNGRAFAGISTGNNATAVAGTNQSADNQIPAAADGIQRAQLKANTACTAGQDAAYDPADGGVFVPYTSAVQVRVGKFVQTKAANSGVQFVGIELTPGAAGGLAGGLLLYIAPQTGTVSSTAENPFTNATLTLPANFERVGDAIDFSVGLIVSNQNSTDTLVVKWKLGSTVICQNVATYDPATGDVMTIRGSLVFSAIGASGVADAYGAVHYGVLAAAATTVAGVVAPTVDTTAALTLTLTAQWSASSANDQVDLKGGFYRLSRKSA